MRLLALLLLALSLNTHNGAVPRPLAAEEPSIAANPVLARMALWMAPEHVGTFDSIFVAQLAPLLARHALTASDKTGRATVDSVFSRLFTVDDLEAIVDAEAALRADGEFNQVLKDLGIAHMDWELYLAPAFPGRSRQAGNGLRQGLWTSIRPKDGLDMNAINAVVQDHDGRLWLATDRGAIRFDGAQFVEYLWSPGSGAGFAASAMVDSSGSLWFGVAGGVIRLDGSSYTRFSQGDGIRSRYAARMLQDRKGNIWITGPGGATMYDGERFHGFGRAEGLADTVAAIAESRDGLLWFTTPDGLVRYDGERFETLIEDLPPGPKLGLVEDQRGQLWVTSGQTLCRIQGDRFEEFSVPDDIRGPWYLTDLFEDRAGRLWMPQGGAPLLSFDGETFEAHTTKDGLVNYQVNGLFEDRDGQLWVACWGGLSRFDGGRFTVFTAESGLGSNGVMTVMEDAHGVIWAGTWNGLSNYRDGRMTLVSDHNVRDLMVDDQGRMWMGARGGVAPFVGTATALLEKDDGLASYDVWAVAQDLQGGMWFGGTDGTIDGGEVRNLSRFNGQQFTTVREVNGMVTELMRERGGNIWIATDRNGVYRFDGEGYTHFTSKDLGANSTWGLGEDRDGGIWIGTSEGVSYYDGSGFFFCEGRRCLIGQRKHHSTGRHGQVLVRDLRRWGDAL